MAKHRIPPNHELWLDITDESLFTDEESPEYKFAWDCVQSLMDSGRFRATDLISLQGLISAAIKHGRYLETSD